MNKELAAFLLAGIIILIPRAPVQALCPSYLFTCNNQHCIPYSWVCDGKDECGDNTDEAQICTKEPCGSKEEFQCKSGRCIPIVFKCDGENDCGDSSDESDCDNLNRYSTGDGGDVTPVVCPPDTFRCPEGKCIPLSLVCNNQKDCKNGEDESLSCRCNKTQFRCTNGLCISKTSHCDGSEDCFDGSDEVNCTACSHNSFLCPHGGINQSPKCIKKSKLCDNNRDCEDGFDEADCSEFSCPLLGCEYECQTSFDGNACYCPEGKQLAPDNRTCIDRDECAEWGYCDQLCENTEGSYECHCANGYTMKNKNRCSATNASSLKLFFTYEKAIIQIIPTENDAKIVTNTTGANGLDFHYGLNTLFWSDIKTKKIHSLQLKNSPSDISTMVDVDITLPDTCVPEAIAVDWIGNKLYVVDSDGQKIDVFDLSGRWHAIVLGSNLTNPTDLALDPTVGFLFIADSSQVVRANMDGTNVHVIVSEDIQKASGIALDIITKRVYWCDSPQNYIGTVDYTGKYKVMVFREESVSLPNRLTLFENWVYWTDTIRHGVMAVDKYESYSSIQSVFYMQEIKDPKAVKAVHALTQPYIKNPCGQNNGGCQHMCIITNAGKHLGYKCACSIGWKLMSDEHNCDLVTEFLLYSEKQFIRGRVLNTSTESFSDAMLPVASQTKSKSQFIGLDFDARDDYIYYSDILQNAIYRVHRNGTSNEIILTSENKSVEGLAIDWISKNLYFTDNSEGKLKVLSTKNVSDCLTLLENLKRPRGIVVHPNKGFIFFSEWARPAIISRLHSDGSNLTVFKNLALGWPNGLSIDFAADRLYWCDGRLDHVQHSSLDGTDVKTVNSPLIKHPFSIVVHKEFMYITDWRLNAIIKLHKLTGDLAESLVRKPTTTRRLFGVKIYSENEQKINNSHPCWNNNGGCSKFCFAVPREDNSTLTAKCGCPDGEFLMPDRRTCRENLTVTIRLELPVEACPISWHFTCNNQRCIFPWLVCDGKDDCLDNSDEEQNCTKATCGRNEFKCQSGRCIPITLKCNSKDDCGDSSDETSCIDETCNSTQFRCNNGRCVPKRLKCDSKNNCEDGSDELDCPKISPKKCDHKKYFQCNSSSICIPKARYCDGTPDCDDKSDEPPTCKQVKCGPNYYKCNNTKCVLKTSVCDGKDDCGDGSDENCNKPPFECPRGHWACPGVSKVCINITNVCDGKPHCPNGTDEGPDCDTKLNRRQTELASKQCKQTPQGPLCLCPLGERLAADGLTCEDINECEPPGICSQYCFNTPGSYYCKCIEEFYEREANEHTCKRKDYTDPWIIYTDKHNIYNIFINSTLSDSVYLNYANVAILDYDMQEQNLYFYDTAAKTIYRSPIVGPKRKEPIIQHDSRDIKGLSVDWIGRKLYWIDQDSKNLDVAELDGSKRKILKSNIINPRALVVHPGIGYLFFTSWDLQAYIGKLGMNGSNFTKILPWKSDKAKPNALAIDFFSDHLYWADANLDYIATSDLDGKHQHIVISGAKVPHVFALTLFDDSIYWTDWELKTISRANKFTGKDFQILVNTTHKSNDIRIYHPLRQLNYRNPCGSDNAGCSQLCLIAPSLVSSYMIVNGYIKKDTISHKCGCSNQYHLNLDNKTCDANCPSDEWLCEGDEAKCIPWFFQCDGERDCKDGSDEPVACPARKCPQQPGVFQCHNGNCTGLTNLCDGTDNCGDGSDEPKLCNIPCPEFQFKCRTTGLCIANQFKCNGKCDCIDSSDEDPAICNKPECDPATNFICKNGQCVPKTRICDFSNDCGDNSDELDCRENDICTKEKPGRCQHSCMNLTSGGYACTCYPGFMLSEENRTACIEIDECKAGTHQCSQICTNLNGSYSCSCHPGFILSQENRTLCLDIDECMTGTHQCSQICTNLNGSHSCSCHKGFKLSDGRFPGVCKVEKGEVAILFANGSEIRAYALRNKKVLSMISNETRIGAIDYHPKSQIVFWVDNNNTIKRSFIIKTMNGDTNASFPQDLNVTVNSNPTALAVDWVGDNLYWTEIDRSNPNPKGRVMVAKIDGRHKRTLIMDLLETPTSIALDPELGHMFWSDAGSEPKIEISWMDGSRRRPFIFKEIQKPIALTIDYSMDHNLYWVDTKLNTIESIKYDGSNRKIILRGELLQNLVSLDLFESDFYWVTKDTRELIQQDKFGRGAPVVIQKNIRNPSSVKVYHDLHYNTSIPNSCIREECSHLCLVFPGGQRCMCPDSSRLSQDEAENACDAALENPQLLGRFRNPGSQVGNSTKSNNSSISSKTGTGNKKAVGTANNLSPVRNKLTNIHFVLADAA